MSEHTGGPIPPGRTWGGADQPEAFYPVVGSVTAEHLDPILLGERKPEEGDCDGDLVWAGRKQPGLPYWEWTLDAWLGNDFMASGEEFTHWLPASVRYLPARVEP